MKDRYHWQRQELWQWYSNCPCATHAWRSTMQSECFHSRKSVWFII